MSTLPVCNERGERVGEYDLDDALLVYDKGLQAVHDAVVQYQAAQRAGSASTRGKGEVAGSGAKPWRQKGTGRARAGYRGSPIWRGGGAAHGPHPRSYAKRLNKKVARLAFRRAFSDKVASGQVLVIEEKLLEVGARTKPLSALATSLRKEGGVLFVLGSPDGAFRRAARNLTGLEAAPAADVCTYQLLRYPLIVLTRTGMEQLERRLRASIGSDL